MIAAITPGGEGSLDTPARSFILACRLAFSRDRSIEIMSQQLRRLEQKAAESNAVAAYLRAKLA